MISNQLPCVSADLSHQFIAQSYDVIDPVLSVTNVTNVNINVAPPTPAPISFDASQLYNYDPGSPCESGTLTPQPVLSFSALCPDMFKNAQCYL